MWFVISCLCFWFRVNTDTIDVTSRFHLLSRKVRLEDYLKSLLWFFVSFTKTYLLMPYCTHRWSWLPDRGLHSHHLHKGQPHCLWPPVSLVRYPMKMHLLISGLPVSYIVASWIGKCSGGEERLFPVVSRLAPKGLLCMWACRSMLHTTQMFDIRQPSHENQIHCSYLDSS